MYSFGHGLPGLLSGERLLINMMIGVPCSLLREQHGKGTFRCGESGRLPRGGELSGVLKPEKEKHR